MADPSDVTIVAPDGLQLEEGHQFLIGFGKDPNICLWCMECTPPGVEGGEPVDQTSQHNTTWIVKLAQSLMELEPMTLVCGYDPDAYDEVIAIINDDEGSDAAITLQFPDVSLLTFWGYMRSFKPQRMVRGSKPLADVVLQPTCWDPENHLEVGPVMTEVAGT